MSILENKIDKIRGAIYGAAIGDAMGATTEFMTANEIKERYPRGVHTILGGGVFNWKCGEVTDDTQMAICVMKAVMECEDNGSIDEFEFISRCSQYFVEWYDSNPKDIGGACAEGILRLKDGKFPAVVSSLGNGGLMRAWPLAVIDELKANVIQNNLTHMNQTCIKAVEKYHKTLRGYLGYGLESCSISTTSALVRPTGCVTNTLNNALHYAWFVDKFEDGIIRPVNNGGDSDTIACVTGGLVGARFGFQAIPEEWIDQLDPKVRKFLNQYIDWACGYLEQKQARQVF